MKLNTTSYFIIFIILIVSDWLLFNAKWPIYQ